MAPSIQAFAHMGQDLRDTWEYVSTEVLFS